MRPFLRAAHALTTPKRPLPEPTTGIEPVTSSLPRKCSTPELRGPISRNNEEWSGKRDSNPRPSAWKADALPTELFPPPRGWKCGVATTYHCSRLLLRWASPTIGGEGRIRTSVGVRRQIYSLLPLATRAPPQFVCALMNWRGLDHGLLISIGEKRYGQSWRRDLNPRPADYKSAALPLSYASPAQTR